MRIGSLIMGLIAGIVFIFVLIYISKPELALDQNANPGANLDASQADNGAQSEGSTLAQNAEGEDGAGSDENEQGEGSEIDIAARIYDMTMLMLLESFGKIDPETGKFMVTPACRRTLPEGINVLIAEHKDYRLNQVDIVDLPCEVRIAIWPDSPLSLSENGYFLINPPTNIMELYYVQAATADINDFYFEAMNSARGIFVRRGQKLLEPTPLGLMFLEELAQKKKEIIALQKDISEEYYDNIVANGVQFSRVEHILDANNVEADWQQVVAEHQGDAPFQIVVNAHPDVIEKLKQIWQGEAAQITAQ